MLRASTSVATNSLVGLTFVGLVAGCAHRDPADRSIDQLKADIVQLQADRDRHDQRLGALESSETRETDASRAVGPREGRPTEQVPRLPVVHVGEGQDVEGESVDDADGGDPRPIVQAIGSPAAAKRGRAGSRSERAPLPDAMSPEAKRSYEAALALVRSKQYDKALDALSAFLVRYPDHPYVENATYWRGECFYAKGEYARAGEQFEGVIARFPYGNKAPDALLKLGLCQEKTGAHEQAQKTFAELQDRYPKSEAVRQIPRP
jgi:tol-pal system protein YbgF